MKSYVSLSESRHLPWSKSRVESSTTGVGTTSHFMPGTTWRTLIVLPPSPLCVNWSARSRRLTS